MASSISAISLRWLRTCSSGVDVGAVYAATFGVRSANHSKIPRFTAPAAAAAMDEERRRPSGLIGLQKRRNEPFRRFCDLSADATEASRNDGDLNSTYLTVRIQCPKDFSVLLSEALLCFHASATTMEEYDNLEDTDEICINAIFPDIQDVHQCILNATDSIGMKHLPNYEICKGQARDWMMAVQENFHPIQVTDGLWIFPKWSTPPNLQAIYVILDPGLAFGTGEHPTTKLCLLLLLKVIKGGERFFDYGTGSGVLGIAALKMGADVSVGIDVEPEAVASVHRNVALNEINSGRMLVYLVPRNFSGLSSEVITPINQLNQSLHNKDLKAEKGKSDVVIANLLLNPLMDLVDDIVQYGKPGAVIGISGVLCDQADQVEEKYSSYLDDIVVMEMDGWALIFGKKKL